MRCPICHDTTHIDVDTHADGYAANLAECGECGALWTTKHGEIVVIHGATPLAANQ